VSKVTLQSKVNRILIATFLVVAAAVTVSMYGYAEVQRAWAKNRVSEEMLRSVPEEIDSLIPSFLLPEQQSGVALLLDRMKRTKNLEDVQILKELSVIAATYPKCTSSELPATCLSRDGNSIATVAEIKESNRSFGYLYKTRRLDTLFISDNWIQTVEAAGMVLLFSFIVLFWFLFRLMSREVPSEIADTLKWIEADLNGTSVPVPESAFKELCDLRNGIAEILDRYDRARDQAVIGQLTSGIMHDLKTPLSSVVTATLLAGEQAVGTTKRQARLENLLKVCQARLPVVGGIIESTLDGSREIHIEKTSTDLLETVDNAVAMNSELIQLRKASVTVNRTDFGHHVPHDPVQISRVVTNLIKNAVEASQTASKIEISFSSDAEKRIVLSFDDNGPGIKEQPSRIFRVFRSTKSHGSGLGLLISRKIVEAHNGDLTYFRSRSLGGARFEVRLPRRTADGVNL
jgi:signal transduction histidine kinase